MCLCRQQQTLDETLRAKAPSAVSAPAGGCDISQLAAPVAERLRQALPDMADNVHPAHSQAAHQQSVPAALQASIASKRPRPASAPLAARVASMPTALPEHTAQLPDHTPRAADTVLDTVQTLAPPLHTQQQPQRLPFGSLPPTAPAAAETVSLNGMAASQAAAQQPSLSSQVAAGAHRGMTPEQCEVVRRVMAWDDYVLVQGLPGSGKTTTISAVAQVRLAIAMHMCCSSSALVAVRHILINRSRAMLLCLPALHSPALTFECKLQCVHHPYQRLSIAPTCRSSLSKGGRCCCQHTPTRRLTTCYSSLFLLASRSCCALGVLMPWTRVCCLTPWSKRLDAPQAP